jgi:hypothetical protein
MASRRSRILAAGGAGAAALLGAIAAWAALAPLPAGPREVVYAIPRGTAVQQSLGASPSVLPAVMRFTLGVRDVLVLRNEDDVPATFGPVRLEPGQTYRVPFHTATAFRLACSVHRDGAVEIVVSAPPRPGWERITWRVRNLAGS